MQPAKHLLLFSFEEPVKDHQCNYYRKYLN
jgi:hypothetical protein